MDFESVRARAQQILDEQYPKTALQHNITTLHLAQDVRDLCNEVQKLQVENRLISGAGTGVKKSE